MTALGVGFVPTDGAIGEVPVSTVRPIAWRQNRGIRERIQIRFARNETCDEANWCYRTDQELRCGFAALAYRDSSRIFKLTAGLSFAECMRDHRRWFMDDHERKHGWLQFIGSAQPSWPCVSWLKSHTHSTGNPTLLTTLVACIRHRAKPPRMAWSRHKRRGPLRILRPPQDKFRASRLPVPRATRVPQRQAAIR